MAPQAFEEAPFTFKLKQEVGQGQDAAADHGHSSHEARVEQDEVTLQCLWEGETRTVTRGQSRSACCTSGRPGKGIPAREEQPAQLQSQAALPTFSLWPVVWRGASLRPVSRASTPAPCHPHLTFLVWAKPKESMAHLHQQGKSVLPSTHRHLLGTQDHLPKQPLNTCSGAGHCRTGWWPEARGGRQGHPCSQAENRGTPDPHAALP